jgi:hypothetical protein
MNTGDAELLTSMTNLASTYRNQGRWKEAEDLQKQELEICSRVLGKEHPDTLISMENLAWILKCQDRYGECMELMVSALRLCGAPGCQITYNVPFRFSGLPLASIAACSRLVTPIQL